jgi:hypothetical protein
MYKVQSMAPIFLFLNLLCLSQMIIIILNLGDIPY